MLSLEVVGPGDGLSKAPTATPYRRDATWRVSWQAVTVTAAYSCHRAVAALPLRLGNGWRWRRRGGTGTGRRWAQDCVHSAFFGIVPYYFRLIRLVSLSNLVFFYYFSLIILKICSYSARKIGLFFLNSVSFFCISCSHFL